MKKGKGRPKKIETENYSDVEDVELYESDLSNNNLDLEEEHEDPDQRRIRMAKDIIEKTKKNLKESRALKNDQFFLEGELSDSEKEDYLNQQSSTLLQNQILQKKKKIKKRYKSKLNSFFLKNQNNFPFKKLKGHLKPITACCFNPKTLDLFSVGKDGSILIFEAEFGYKRDVFSNAKNSENAHKKQILCLDISQDGRFMITSGKDRLIKIWDLQNKSFITDLKGHRKQVNSLRFKLNSYEFYSGSSDGTLKIWDAAQKGLIDTHFGHQSEMFDISVLNENTIVSCSFDRKPIIWKIDKDSQMIFNTRKFSLDCISALNNKYFITGSENGELSLWNINKKNPRFVINRSHKKGWLSSVVSFFNGDIVITGANDGFIKFYETV